MNIYMCVCVCVCNRMDDILVMQNGEIENRHYKEIQGHLFSSCMPPVKVILFANSVESVILIDTISSVAL